MKERRRRLVMVSAILLFLFGGGIFMALQQEPVVERPETAVQTTEASGQASDALVTLPVKGRAPKTGYSRAAFGGGWDDLGACDVRNHILRRDMTDVKVRSEVDCTVLSGTLQDPYTGKTIQFVRGPGTSDDVQIDHVVALSDAWQKGAQVLSEEARRQLANDPLELLAVDGAANQAKSDADAASWLPPNKAYRCQYVARQIAVKVKYHLWVTAAERDTMRSVLVDCPGQALPVTSP